VSGITQSTALWYASRATGVVALVLFTLVVLLGILVNRQGRLPGLPRFAVTGLHRSISLLAAVFLAIHVVTAIADPYVTIRLIASVVPFSSGYEPFQVGLGAVALDLIAAVIITSLLRARIGRRLWRGVHWAAYASYPVAVLHGFTAAKDLRSGGLLYLTVGCIVAVAAAVCYRLAVAGSVRRPVSAGGRRDSGSYRTGIRNHPAEQLAPHADGPYGGPAPALADDGPALRGGTGR
jgi:predicted ferric reductase